MKFIKELLNNHKKVLFIPVILALAIVASLNKDDNSEVETKPVTINTNKKQSTEKAHLIKQNKVKDFSTPLVTNRNPFIPPEKAEEKKTLQATPIFLKGIIKSGNNRWVLLENLGKTSSYKINDVIQGYTIQSIADNEVILVTNHNKLCLKL